MTNRDNISDINEERLKRGLKQFRDQRGGADGGAGGNEPPNMNEASGRLSKLEGAYDALKVLPSVMLAVVALVLTVMIGGFAFLGTQVGSLVGQVGRLDGKIDGNAQRLNDRLESGNNRLESSVANLNEKLNAVPQRLAEEFRAMRAEMSAQTSAIANAVTATRQTPPQVLLVPAPVQPSPPVKP